MADDRTPADEETPQEPTAGEEQFRCQRLRTQIASGG